MAEPEDEGRSEAVARVSYVPKNWKKAYSISILAFGCLLNGFSIGFFVPGFKELLHGTTEDFYGDKFKLTLHDAAWISGLLNLGAAMGYLVGLRAMELIGRKGWTLVNITLFLIGYLIVFFAHTPHQLFVARFFAGLAVGGTIAVSGVYVFEIASKQLHGVLGSALQVMVIVGILLAVAIGSCVEWDYLALVFLAFLVPYLIGIGITPESPYWLLKRGKEFSASVNLEWFEGRLPAATTDQKLATLREKLQQDNAVRNPSIMSLKPHWKALALCMILVITLQLSGFNILIYYSVIIFDMAVTSMDPNLATVISLLCLLSSFAVVILFTFRLKRKPVLIFSMLGMAICQFALGIYFSTINETHWYQERYNQTVSHSEDFVHSTKAIDHGYSWLPILVTCLCLFLGNTGWFSVTWVVIGELLPEETHNMANRIMITFAYVSAFISTKTFADLVEAIHPHGAFFLYGCVCIFGAIFTCIFVPETKDKNRNATHRERPVQYSSVPDNC